MNETAVGPVAPPFESIGSIAVLRGGGLGDLLFAMPAIHALAAAYPQARITLLGTPLHAELLAGRPGPVDEVAVLPFAEGVRPGGSGDTAADAQQVQDFLARMREREFDLAVQVHGGGRFSNPFLLELGAKHTVGTRTEDAAELERTIPYHYYQHEVLRALEVAGMAGATTTALSPRIEVTEHDRDEARTALEALARSLPDAAGRRAPRLVIHPGASDARRQWPVESFAALATRAVTDGYQVLLVGAGAEAELCRRIWEQVPAEQREAVHVLAGKLSLPGLVGVLESADVMLGNDSGPRHLAQAVVTPTVGIFWAGNMIMAAPLERSRHRVHLGWVTHCPECGIDVTQVGWNAPRCDHTFPLTAAVSVDEVYANITDLTASGELLSAGRQLQSATE